jgi:hypothetical protein
MVITIPSLTERVSCELRTPGPPTLHQSPSKDPGGPKRSKPPLGHQASWRIKSLVDADPLWLRNMFRKHAGQSVFGVADGPAVQLIYLRKWVQLCFGRIVSD